MKNRKYELDIKLIGLGDFRLGNVSGIVSLMILFY